MKAKIQLLESQLIKAKSETEQAKKQLKVLF